MCDKVKTDERRRQVVISLSCQSSSRSLTRVAQKRPKLSLRQAPEERGEEFPVLCCLPPVSSGNGVGTMIRKVMDAIYPRVGGLDVHEETVMACRRRLISDGQAESEVKVF